MPATYLNQHGQEIEDILWGVAGHIEDAGDTVDGGKLVGQLADAFKFVAGQRAAEILGASELLRHGEKWPDPEPELIQETGQAFGNWTLAAWQEISPTKVSVPAEVLPLLFPPKALVCFGPKRDVHYTCKLGATLYELARRAQYVVPNPAKVPFIELPDGRRSLKCAANFPERRFVIVEFDRSRIDPAGRLSLAALLDLQAALHAYLESTWAPLSLLTFSGHKSLHGWYPCVGVDEDRVLAMFRFACRLGADPCLASPSFFTRMPCGLHENGSRQTVHYLNLKSEE